MNDSKPLKTQADVNRYFREVNLRVAERNRAYRAYETRNNKYETMDYDHLLHLCRIGDNVALTELRKRDAR